MVRLLLLQLVAVAGCLTSGAFVRGDAGAVLDVGRENMALVEDPQRLERSPKVADSDKMMKMHDNGDKNDGCQIGNLENGSLLTEASRRKQRKKRNVQRNTNYIGREKKNSKSLKTGGNVWKSGERKTINNSKKSKPQKKMKVKSRKLNKTAKSKKAKMDKPSRKPRKRGNLKKSKKVGKLTKLEKDDQSEGPKKSGQEKKLKKEKKSRKTIKGKKPNIRKKTKSGGKPRIQKKESRPMKVNTKTQSKNKAGTDHSNRKMNTFAAEVNLLEKSDREQKNQLEKTGTRDEPEANIKQGDGSLRKGNKMKPEKQSSNGNTMLVEACQATHTLGYGESLVIFSDNSGQKKKCTAVLKSPAGTQMILSCPQVNLNAAGCRKEQIIFSGSIKGSRKKLKLCDKDAPSDTLIDNNVLKMKYKRKKLKSSDCSGGFLCVVTTVGDATTTTAKTTTTTSMTTTAATTPGAVTSTKPTVSFISTTGTTTAPTTTNSTLTTPTTTTGTMPSTTTMTNTTTKSTASSMSTTWTTTALSTTTARATTPTTTTRIMPSITTKSPASSTGTTLKTTASTTTSPCNTVRPFCDGCGIAPISVADSKIVNGEDASAGEYPYQVFVGFVCGGSLIKKKWVLTAAHCFSGNENPSQVIVILGTLRLDPLDAGSLQLQASKIIMHEDYNQNNFENDIALVELSQEVTFTDKIKPICLAEDGDIPFGGKVVATGWGTLQYGTNNFPQKLQEVELDVISEDKCQELASANPTKFICALTPLKDTCQGDSGGPLVARLCPGRWVQVGIVSHGEECAKQDAPGVYTRVSKYISWIAGKTNSNTC